MGGVVYVVVVVIRLVIKALGVIYGFLLPKICPPSNFVKKYKEWAIVTGCTQGIGRYYAEELARLGMNIVLVSRNESKLEDLARTVKNLYGVDTRIIVADFTNPSILQTIVTRIDEFKFDIGVLVNNVGLLGGHAMPFLELEKSTVLDIINVNVTAATFLCHSWLPKMIALSLLFAL